MYHPRKRINRPVFLILLVVIFGMSSSDSAQAEIQAEDLSVNHIFGEQIDIQARIVSEKPILDLRVVIQSEDDSILANDPVPISPDGEIFYILDISQNPIRVFSELSIRFEIDLENGETTTYNLPAYFYDDNRFSWESLSTDEFTIYWYQSNPDLGQNVMNIAYEGLQKIQQQVKCFSSDGVKIYVYSSALEMQETLSFSGQSAAWIAGHADPDLNLIVVSLPPGPDQSLEIKRQIPHELMHVLLYQKLDTNYGNLPRWLNEGLASTAELFPNPDYQLLLDKAYERGSLIPISDLCASFPIDAANFQLSYAESTAFTWYLQQNYGNADMEALINAYANGMGCEQATEEVFGIPLTKLEADWRSAMFNENKILNAIIFFAPWIIIIIAMFSTPVILTINGIRKQKDEAAL